MTFELRWTPEATATFEELSAAAARSRSRSSKQAGLFKQVAKAIRLLGENPRHPGLETHPYESIPNPFKKGEKVFEAYAQNKTPSAYRVFWCYGPEKGQMTILAITPHP